MTAAPTHYLKPLFLPTRFISYIYTHYESNLINPDLCLYLCQ